MNNKTIFQQALSRVSRAFSEFAGEETGPSDPAVFRVRSICIFSGLVPGGVRTPAVSPHLYLHSVTKARAGTIRKLTRTVPSRFE